MSLFLLSAPVFEIFWGRIITNTEKAIMWGYLLSAMFPVGVKILKESMIISGLMTTAL